MNPQLVDLQRDYEAKTKLLAEKAKEAQTDEKNSDGTPQIKSMPDAWWVEFRNRDAEVKTIAQKMADISALEAAIVNAGRGNVALPYMQGSADEVKSFGQLFTSHEEFKSAPNRKQVSFKMNLGTDLKTLMQTSAGYAPANPRTNIVALSAQRPPRISDIIPSSPTELSIVKYMLETLFTNNAATAAEGGQYGESALKYEEQTSLVQKIATFLPVTDEQLDDVQGLQQLINQRLTLMLQQVEDTQLLTGSGTPPDLAGILNVSGIQTQAQGTDAAQDAILKAFTLARFTGWVEPDYVVIHPTDWQNIRLAKDAVGQYLWGGPSIHGVEEIWGKPIVVSPVITAGTALTGNFAMYSHVSRRKEVEIDISNSHSDYFIKGKLAIRVQQRISLEVYRPSAFVTVTGLTAP